MQRSQFLAALPTVLANATLVGITAAAGYVIAYCNAKIKVHESQYALLVTYARFANANSQVVSQALSDTTTQAGSYASLLPGLRCGLYRAGNGARDQNVDVAREEGHKYIASVNEYLTRWALYEEILALPQSPVGICAFGWVPYVLAKLPDKQLCRSVVRRTFHQSTAGKMVEETLADRRERTAIRCSNVFCTVAPVEVADKKMERLNDATFSALRLDSWSDVLRGQVTISRGGIGALFSCTLELLIKAAEEGRPGSSIAVPKKEFAEIFSHCTHTRDTPSHCKVITEEEKQRDETHLMERVIHAAKRKFQLHV